MKARLMSKAMLTVASVVVTSWFVATLAQPGNNPATKPVPRKDSKGWMARHETFVAKAKKGGVDVLFLGDSITQGWEGNGKDVWAKTFAPMKAANFGIGGDRTQHVLWRITEGKELDGIDPKVAVIMIGTNNFGSDSAEQTAEGVRAIIAELHKQKPKTKILLLGVFPRSGTQAKNLKNPTLATAAELHPKVKAINEILAKMDNGKTVKYLDIGNKFLVEDGALPKEIMYDFLHLTPKGYQIWADAIEKPVEDLLKN